MIEQQEQVTEKYLFIITPIQIKSSSKLRSNSRKSILIKLGNQTAKCQALNTPVHLQVDVLYSRTLQKYCPLKGIIKIYDVAEDGTEIISCVGGFQTDELLNESKTNAIIEKQIGTSKLKMEISIHNKNQGKRPEEKHSPKNLKIDVRDDRKQNKRQERRSSLDRIPGLRSSGLFSKGLDTSCSRRNMSPRFKLEGPSLARPSSKADISYESVEASRNLYELEQSKKQLTILKKLAAEKDKKINSLERQIEGAQTTIRNLKETNRHLGEQNQYLREKNDKVERSLYHKENMIDSLRKELDKLTTEFQQVDGNLYNSTLEIDELKEEVSNLNETIDKYREKYGDLKQVKNRAIEMQIKQCLRWIDLQNRDLDMSQVQETTPSQHEHSEDRQNSLSSVIRGIQIDKVPKQQMTIIRGELVRILQRVDEMMAK